MPTELISPDEVRVLLCRTQKHRLTFIVHLPVDLRFRSFIFHLFHMAHP